MSGAFARLNVGARIAPARFVLFVVAMAGGVALQRWVTPGKGWADAVALGFDGAALLFLASLLPLLRDADAETMRRHSAQNDANRIGVLVITTALTGVVMAAIAGELPAASKGDSMAMVRLIGTLALTWLFANVTYGLHYAHLFYSHDGKSGGDRGGIDFPGTETPTYLDFVYFAFTLGMTFQTSDVVISGPAVRRVATLHCLAAFVFNIGVIAFTINAVG